MSTHEGIAREIRESRIGIGELWGGLAAMLVAMPSSIAFGVAIFTAASPGLAGEGAFAGIIGAAVLGILAPLVSRNGGFITAPCAPAAAVMGGLAAELAANGVGTVRLLMLLAITAFLSGGLQVAYGAFRFGRVIKFIPYQVVNGYLSGVALIIAFAQIPKLLGVAAPLGEAVTSPDAWRWPGILVGLTTIVAMVLASRITRAIPAAIFGLGGGVVAFFAIAAVRPELRSIDGNPLVIGRIQSAGSLLASISERFSALGAISASDFVLILPPALTLSVLLSIDTLKTGVVLDALTRTRHDSNRELIGQGVANTASFFAGGIPGAGTMGPTLVNISSGGRTSWSGVIEGTLVAIAFLAIGDLIAWVPIAALAGILLVVAWRMFDFNMFRLLAVPSARLDFVVIAAVVVVAVSVGLIQASLVGVVLAIALFMRNQMRVSVILHKADLRKMRSKRHRSSEQLAILDERGERALFVQLRGDLFFGTTDQLFTELEDALARCRYVLMDLRRVESMDYTAAHLLEQMEERLRERDGRLLFSGMPASLPSREEIEHYLHKFGSEHGENTLLTFETRDSALEWMEERILEEAGYHDKPSAPPLALEAIEVFRDLDAASIAELQDVVGRRSLSAGESVFGLGEPGDEVFFVRSGRIHILLPLAGGRRHHLATMGRGDFFGEMAFLDRGVRSAEAQAAKPTELFSISRADFDRLTARNETLARKLFERLARAIAQRLRVTDGELQSLEEN